MSDSDRTHPFQTTVSSKIHNDKELAEAALKELRYFIWRADVPPGLSTLDPNLRRAESHLEYLIRSLNTDKDQ